MLRRVIADRQGKEWFYVFDDPMIQRFNFNFIQFIIMYQTVSFVFLTR